MVPIERPHRHDPVGEGQRSIQERIFGVVEGIGRGIGAGVTYLGEGAIRFAGSVVRGGMNVLFRRRR